MVHKSSRCRLALNLHSSIFHQSSALENQFLLKCITTDQSVWESHHRNSFGISRKLQNGLDQLQQYCVNSFSSGLRVTDVDVKITSSLVGVSSKHWLQENCMWSILKSLKSYFPLLCCVLVTYSALKKTKQWAARLPDGLTELQTPRFELKCDQQHPSHCILSFVPLLEL